MPGQELALWVTALFGILNFLGEVKKLQLRRRSASPASSPDARLAPMSNKRATPDSAITMDDVDGFSAAELFGQGG